MNPDANPRTVLAMRDAGRSWTEVSERLRLSVAEAKALVEPTKKERRKKISTPAFEARAEAARLEDERLERDAWRAQIAPRVRPRESVTARFTPSIKRERPWRESFRWHKVQAEALGVERPTVGLFSEDLYGQHVNVHVSTRGDYWAVYQSIPWGSDEYHDPEWKAHLPRFTSEHRTACTAWAQRRWPEITGWTRTSRRASRWEPVVHLPETVIQ